MIFWIIKKFDAPFINQVFKLFLKVTDYDCNICDADFMKLCDPVPVDDK